MNKINMSGLNKVDTCRRSCRGRARPTASPSPGHDVTPGTVAREIGGRSPGAVRNGMDKLTGTGVLILTREAPGTYALADNPPADR